MKSIVVNFYAGPGAGKTTGAWELAAQLKKMNVNVEYVSEYAKELVWSEQWGLLDGSRENQAKIFEEQARRIDSIYGKVEVIVTDCPITLAAVYLKEPDNEFTQIVLDKYEQHNNFNLFIRRDDQNFKQAGRIQNLAESKKIDVLVKDFLNEHNLFFCEYNRNSIKRIADNVVYSRAHNKHFKDKDVAPPTAKFEQTREIEKNITIEQKPKIKSTDEWER